MPFSNTVHHVYFLFRPIPRTGAPCGLPGFIRAHGSPPLDIRSRGSNVLAATSLLRRLLLHLAQPHPREKTYVIIPPTLPRLALRVCSDRWSVLISCLHMSSACQSLRSLLPNYSCPSSPLQFRTWYPPDTPPAQRAPKVTPHRLWNP